MSPCVSFNISYRNDPIPVKFEHLISGNWGETSVYRTKLNLQEWIQFQQQTFLNIIVEAPHSKVGFVFKCQYFSRVLKMNIKYLVFSDVVVLIST